MATYRELLARRNEFSIYSPEWKEIGDLIDAYVRAQILACHMEFANMIVGDLGDIAEYGTYENDPELKKEYDGYIEWFRKWNFDEYADELESFIEQ